METEHKNMLAESIENRLGMLENCNFISMQTKI